MNMRFHYHCLRRDVSNFSLLRHRDYTGFLVSMHQSGTHWLKHMLALAIATRHDLPPPRYSHANDIIGGVRDAAVHERAPRLVSSHSIPHLLLASAAIHRLFSLPPYVVLVRDIRASLVANYEKWKSHYGCGFDEFVRGDVAGKRFNNDLWWCIRFCNAWGRIEERVPGRVLVVRYEELQRDALGQLRRVDDFLNLGLGDDALRAGVAGSTKEKMAAKPDPSTPGAAAVVRRDSRPAVEWFGPRDREFLAAACRACLKHDFGYDYHTWVRDSSS